MCAWLVRICCHCEFVLLLHLKPLFSQDIPFAAVDYRQTPSSATPLFLNYELTKQMLDVALITNNVGETMR